MSTGHILFYGGAALLVVTIFLAIIFKIFKPKYRPENAVYYEAASGQSAAAPNGYPTDRVTRRRTAPQQSATRRDDPSPTETDHFDEQLSPTSPAGYGQAQPTSPAGYGQAQPTSPADYGQAQPTSPAGYGQVPPTSPADYDSYPPTEFTPNPFDDLQM